MQTRTTRAIAVGVLAAVGIGGAAVVAGARDVTTSIHRTTIASAPRIAIDTRNGDIEVIAAPIDHIEVTRRASTTNRESVLGIVRDGDALRLTGGCRHGWGVPVPLVGPVCRVAYVVRVPATTAVDLQTGHGDVTVTGISGAIRVQTGAGDILGNQLLARNARFESGFGGVDATFRARPTSVEVHSGRGDASLTVPAGAYRVSIDAGLGSANVYGITRDDAASSSLTVESGAGDATINGMEG